MKKRKPFFFALACLSVGLFVCTGCDSDDVLNSGKGNSNNGQPSTLNFATSQTVKLQLNYNVSDGVTSTFDLYSEYPLDEEGFLRSDLTSLASGIYISGISELVRTLPSYVEELYLYSPNLFVPLLSYAKVEDGIASFSQADVTISVDEVRSLLTRNSPQFWKKEITKYLKTTADFYSSTVGEQYKYDLINPDMVKEIPDEVFTAIGLAFPEKTRADEKYYKDASITLLENAEVYLSILHCGALFNNSLSYVVYEGDKELNDLTENEKMELDIINIFQFADVNTNSMKNKKMGLTPGHYAQLLYKNEAGDFVKEFPKGAKIGWILHSNAFNESEFSVNSSYRAFSPPNWNDASDSKSGELIRTIYFAAKDDAGNIYNCFGFEDQKNYDDDCNDLIFHIYTNPVEAIDPPALITDEDIEKTESLEGILAFEDKWPKQDDYDLNDVVLRYNSEITYIKKTNATDATVKKVEDTFTFIHTGASYNNAFSYKVNINSRNIKSAQIDNVDYAIISDGSGFIIDLCPNVKEVIVPFEFGTPVKTYKVTMEFEDDAISQDEFASLAAPYNPFITPRETSGAEVHLPMYSPTSRVDYSLFGTADDHSDQQTLWYVSGENNLYPFAIHLSGRLDNFVVPKEFKKINVTYPEYTLWIDSNMQQYKDWYLNPVD